MLGEPGCDALHPAQMVAVLADDLDPAGGGIIDDGIIGQCAGCALRTKSPWTRWRTTSARSRDQPCFCARLRHVDSRVPCWHLRLEPPKRRVLFRIKQMRRPAAAIIRCTEARDRGLKPPRVLKHFSPLLLQFAVGEGIPYLDGRGETEQIVDVPVGLANGCKMMADASSNAAMAAGASEVPVKSRDKREPPQPANDEPLSLLTERFSPFHRTPARRHRPSRFSASS